jgi:hypothetical protein
MSMKKHILSFFITGISFVLIGVLFNGCAGGAAPREEEGAPVMSDFQEWADANRNGRLEADEEQVLVESVFFLLKEPHDVETPVDEIFDVKHDGFIDMDEVERARFVFFGEQLVKLYEFAPEFAHFVDINQDEIIDDVEIEQVIDYLFYNPEMTRPHEISHPMDESIDRNEDGFIDEEEIKEAAGTLLSIVSILPYEAEGRFLDEPERFPVDSVLAQLADLNNDGFVGPKEQAIMEKGLTKPHQVKTLFDERIDFNGNGKIEQFEIEKAARAGEVPIEEREIEAIPVRTPVDKMFDIDENKMVTEEEIQQVVLYFLQGEHTVKPNNEFDRFFDFNKNKIVEEDELFLARETFFRPHPVDPERKVDKELDANRDGFIDPEEIGIAAGFHPDIGEFPTFDDILEEALFRRESMFAAGEEDGAEPRETDEESTDTSDTETTADTSGDGDAEQDDDASGTEATAATTDTTEEAATTLLQKRLGQLQDKKLAVVGISATSSSIADDTAQGILVFVENAFVNTGAVKVVDRQNIEKIVKEYEFQANELVDEQTAVEIGKLTGSDIIVTGTISYVGKKYYLNIKLISVETAEIIGSSIADSEDSSTFYEMTNEAVLKLF